MLNCIILSGDTTFIQIKNASGGGFLNQRAVLFYVKHKKYSN